MSPDRIDLPAASAVVIKGVRDEPSPDDGRRVLADRLWPRGVSKERAALDEWAKDATPSTALRRAFHSGDLAWEQFVPAYRAELEEEPAARGHPGRGRPGPAPLRRGRTPPVRPPHRLLCFFLEEPERIGRAAAGLAMALRPGPGSARAG